MKPEGHAKKGAKGKRKRGTRRQQPVLSREECPRPEKHVFPTKDRAKTWLKRRTGPLEKTGLRPYRCVCGGWHVGHSSRIGKSPPPP